MRRSDKLSQTEFRKLAERSQQEFIRRCDERNLAALQVYSRVLPGFAERVAQHPLDLGAAGLLAELNEGHARFEAETGLPSLRDVDAWRVAGIKAGAEAALLDGLKSGNREALNHLVERIAAWWVGCSQDWRVVKITELADRREVTSKAVRDWLSGRTKSPVRMRKQRHGWVRIHPDDWEI